MSSSIHALDIFILIGDETWYAYEMSVNVDKTMQIGA